jgi:hypothetical protein
MKRFLSLLLILLVAFGIYWFAFRDKTSKPKAPKPEPIALKKHSDLFNKSVDTLMGSYLNMKNAFIEADTSVIKNSASSFLASLDKLPLEELKSDTASIFETAQVNIADMKSNVQSLLSQTDITEMRRDFSSLTEVMYPSFFKSINYEGEKLFLQNCPMAFNDEIAANWISNSSEIMNPYLGKTHPKYKATMLHCGEVKDSIAAQ